MLVSIVISTYNGEAFISDQIESILQQTIQDFELLICDDSSTDKTYSILERYATKDNRIHIQRNSTNQGFYRNYEKLLYLCKGDFIAFCDQDDIWEARHLELLLHAIGSKSMACGNTTLMDEDGQPRGVTNRYYEGLDRIPKNDISWARSLYFFRNPLLGNSMLFRHDILRYALPFPKANYHDAWISCLSAMTNGISYVDEPITRYRRLPTSVTGLKTKRKSKIRHLIYGMILHDRLAMSQTILNRISDLPTKKKHFLNQVIKIVERHSTRKGRIRNRFHLLSHYYNIYNCSLLKWL